MNLFLFYFNFLRLLHQPIFEPLAQVQTMKLISIYMDDFTYKKFAINGTFRLL